MASPETLAFFKRLCTIPANQKCVDCGSPNPQWASAKFSCFFCLECSGQHRGLGVHIDFVRSVYMDAWKDSELKRMELGGNAELLRVFAAAGISKLPIDQKYTSHAALLYREQLACRAEGRVFNESATRAQIVAMEREAEERRARLSSRPQAAGNNFSSRGRSDSQWENLSKTTSDIFSRAWQSTASATANVQTQWQSGALLDSWRESVNSVTARLQSSGGTGLGNSGDSDSARGGTVTGGTAAYPGIGNTPMPRPGSADPTAAVISERAKQITARGVHILQASIGTCIETLQPQRSADPAVPASSWRGVLSRLSNGSQDIDAKDFEEKNSPRDKSDLSDLFAGSRNDTLDSYTRAAPSSSVNAKTTDPSDLSDLLGSRDLLGGDVGNSSSTTDAALDALLSGTGSSGLAVHSAATIADSKAQEDPWTWDGEEFGTVSGSGIAPEPEPAPAAEEQEDWTWSGVGSGEPDWMGTTAPVPSSAVPSTGSIAAGSTDWDKGW